MSFRVVADSVVSDNIFSKTVGGLTTSNENFRVLAGKQLRADTVVGADGSSIVAFPNNLTSPSINVDTINERTGSNGIALTHPLRALSNATITGTLFANTIDKRTGSNIDILENTSLGVNKTLTVDRMIGRTELLIDSGCIVSGELTAPIATLQTIDILTGTNLTLNGSLVMPNNSAISTFDVSADILRHRNAEPILAASSLEIFTGKKLITPRIDAANIYGVASGRINMAAGLDLASVAESTTADKLLMLNASNQVVYKLSTGIVPKFQENFAYGFTVVSNVADPASELALILQNPWFLKFGVPATNELAIGFNFDSTRDSSMRLTWGTFITSMANRLVWLSSLYSPIGSFEMNCDFSITHATHGSIENQTYFVGLGKLQAIASGYDLEGCFGLVYTQGLNSNRWRVAYGGSGAPDPIVFDTSIAVDTTIQSLKITMTRSGGNMTGSIWLNGVSLGDYAMLNAKVGPRILHSWNKTASGIPSNYGINLYSLTIT